MQYSYLIVPHKKWPRLQAELDEVSWLPLTRPCVMSLFIYTPNTPHLIGHCARSSKQIKLIVYAVNELVVGCGKF